MIERRVIYDETDVKLVMRFAQENKKGEVVERRYAARRSAGGKHEWYVTLTPSRAYGFDDVAWARRYSKIVKRFKEFAEGAHGKGWRTEVVEMTDRRVRTREIKQLYPVVDAIEALADLGRATNKRIAGGV